MSDEVTRMEISDDGDAVFDELAGRFLDALEQSGPDYRLVKEWTAAYPQYADDLVEIAYCRQVVGPLTSGRQRATQVDDAISDVGLKLLATFFPDAAPASQLTSLFEASRQVGLTPHNLAKRLRIGVSVLAKLNQRLVDATSVPTKLVSLVAQALQLQLEDVTRYLRGAPRRPQSVAYKSKAVPTIPSGTLQSFLDALTTGGDTPSEDIAFWLAEVDSAATQGEESRR